MRRALKAALGLMAIAATTASVSQPYQATPPAEAWQIGPIIKGRNYSVGMPLNPAPARQGFSIDLPNPTVDAGHVHYVTYRHGPLDGKSRIVMRYRVDAARKGTRFVPQEHPHMPAIISLYFQRFGDSWTAKRGYQYYRWYAPAATAREVATGEYEIDVRLDNPDWISVMSGSSGQNPEAFSDALSDADRVGFVMGSHSARGHGVYATGPARLTVLSFRVM